MMERRMTNDEGPRTLEMSRETMQIFDDPLQCQVGGRMDGVDWLGCVACLALRTVDVATEATTLIF